mmetsp:Transcript_16044/g.32227  ORF Transcript_16044/g.32227 Transcript_16044/m.32227 type:complete len:205 (-) Transcript_16044:14-628(-)
MSIAALTSYATPRGPTYHHCYYYACCFHPSYLFQLLLSSCRKYKCILTTTYLTPLSQAANYFYCSFLYAAPSPVRRWTADLQESVQFLMHMTDIHARKLFCLHVVCLLVSESQRHRPSIFSWTRAPAMTPPPRPEQLSVLSGGDCSSQRSAAGVCSNYISIETRGCQKYFVINIATTLHQCGSDIVHLLPDLLTIKSKFRNVEL